MKIVILNECFFSNSHIERLKKLGELSIYEDTNSVEQALERTKDADIVIGDCFLTPFNGKFFNSAKNLKLVAINSTGFDRVDVEAASKKEVRISNVPNFSTEAVAEHVFALIFAVLRKIPMGDKECREKNFEIDPANKNHRRYLGYNLKGKTLGIVGFGNIGKRVTELALGIGMKVMAYNRTPKKFSNVVFSNLEEVLKSSDIVSLHLAFSKETKHIIGKKEIAMMKRNSVIINTGRDQLIESDALFKNLKEGKLMGAGLDVMEGESSQDIFKLDNVVFSPHSAWFTEESLENIPETITNNVESFVKGKNLNIIN